MYFSCLIFNLILEQHQHILIDWTINDNMFVLTRASEHVFKCISMQQSVTVTGNPGVGKTATMRYVALKMKDKGYTVVPTKSPEDIRNFSKKDKKMLFVVDDVCAITC
jgi:predicted GTPase